MFLVSLNSSAIFLSMIFGMFGKFAIEIGDRDFFWNFFRSNKFSSKKKSQFLVEKKIRKFSYEKVNEKWKFQNFDFFLNFLILIFHLLVNRFFRTFFCFKKYFFDLLPKKKIISVFFSKCFLLLQPEICSGIPKSYLEVRAMS